MENTPKSLRLQIGIFGRTNVGKSSFINLITSQDVSIVSPQPGTTTDVVEKAMEFPPLGPVVFIDTAGVDDDSRLSSDRARKTVAVFGRADVFVVLTEAGVWGEYETTLSDEARKRGVPLVIVVNKADTGALTDDFRKRLAGITPDVMACSCVGDAANRETVVGAFKEILLKCVSDELARQPQALVSDILPPGGLALLVAPIDAGAPKGRLIAPQVQTIRDVLDGGGVVMIVKESEYATALATLNKRPDLVICDSQVIQKIADETPPDFRLTTFSVLLARFKGDLGELVSGAAAIGKLKAGDRVLIAESCTHHAGYDDIGRVQIPSLLREQTEGGASLQIDVCGGRDYPENLERYSLIIHCGACMLTRREMASRIKEAQNKNVPITNYGMAISYFHEALERVTGMFNVE
jgi:[FeFe] hydrogenase H-cluster maturation GTPase HydF